MRIVTVVVTCLIQTHACVFTHIYALHAMHMAYVPHVHGMHKYT